MKRKPLDEILQDLGGGRELRSPERVGQIVKEFYEVPVCRMFEKDNRETGKENLKLLDYLDISVRAAPQFTLGELLGLVEIWMTDRRQVENSWVAERILIGVTKLKR